MADYRAFLQVQAVRRRVQTRLHGAGNYLTAHVFIFVAVVLLLGIIGQLVMNPPTFSGFGYGMAVWSVLLVVHGLVAWTRGGAYAGRRSAVIEEEIARLLENDDLSTAEAFDLHERLERVALSRAKTLLPISFLTMFCAMIWMLGLPVLASGAARLPYQITPMIALIFIFWWMIALWFAERQEKRSFSDARANFSAGADDEKRKFDQLALSDDGELVAYDADDEQPRQRMER